MREYVLIIFLVFITILNISSIDALAGPKTPKSITGAFLQLDDANLAWNEKQWDEELRVMKNFGMDTLVIDAVARGSFAFYKSDAFPLSPKCGTHDPLKVILDCAAKYRIKVFIGLYSWNWESQTEKDFAEFANRCKKIADDILGNYSKHRVFAGWYVLGFEIANTPAADDAGTVLYSQIVSYLHRLTEKKPVLMAPYFSLAVTPEQMEDSWKVILPVIKPDILALQDGVGCDRKLTPVNIKPYFKAMANACKSAKVRFWADTEVFDIPAGWKTASPDRIVQQLKSVSPYVEKIIIWEYNHYLSPVRNQKGAQELFAAIKKTQR